MGLANGDGGGHDSWMERTVRLEEWSKMSEQRMARIEDKLDRSIDIMNEVKVVLAGMATKRDLANYTFAGLGLGLALMAFIIGGVIGGLAWIKVDAPIVIPPGHALVQSPPASFAVVPVQPKGP